ncbi:MAG: hypothetical protein ACU0BB_09510 [Paracoccaceae bacterium]
MGSHCTDKGLVITLGKKFGLNNLEAKTVWLSCPEFQEKFSRERIQGSKSRGAKPYGSQIWLKRRFKLSDAELEHIFDDLWACAEGQKSTRFMELMTPERIAEGHLTDTAQRALRDLQSQYFSK